MSVTYALTLTLALLAQHLSPERVVGQAYEAFNAHDVDQFVSHVSEDVRWMTVRGDAVATETAGREALRTYLQRYFRRLPTVRSRIESVSAVAGHVAVHERVTWTSARGERSQSALAVYEVVRGRITRVWYYEAAMP